MQRRDGARSHSPQRAELSRIRRLEDLPLRCLAPFSPAQLDPGSIDLIVSRTVLEHIPVPVLTELLAGLCPRLAPGGLAVHLVDRSISPVQFLGWSESRHCFVNWLTGDGENRLRHHEHPPLFRAAGYRVLREESDIHTPTLEWLACTKRVAPWSGISSEQLAVLVSLHGLDADGHGSSVGDQNRYSQKSLSAVSPISTAFKPGRKTIRRHKLRCDCIASPARA